MRTLQRNLKRTTDTFLFISHTTNVLLFKFRCNIFIGVRIIKEMPDSVGHTVDERSLFLQIMLQPTFCTFSSGLKFVAIAIKIRLSLGELDLDIVRVTKYEISLRLLPAEFHKIIYRFQKFLNLDSNFNTNHPS